VAEAFKGAGWTYAKHPIAIFGSDATKQGIAAIKEKGFYQGTVYMNLVKELDDLLDRCITTMKTGKVNDAEKVVYFKMTPITIDNTDVVK
jgi:hypothetical protein